MNNKIILLATLGLLFTGTLFGCEKTAPRSEALRQTEVQLGLHADSFGKANAFEQNHSGTALPRTMVRAHSDVGTEETERVYLPHLRDAETATATVAVQPLTAATTTVPETMHLATLPATVAAPETTTTGPPAEESDVTTTAPVLPPSILSLTTTTAQPTTTTELLLPPSEVTSTMQTTADTTAGTTTATTTGVARSGEQYPLQPLKIGLPAYAEGKKTVALTFDDGPNPETIHRLLDVLEKYDIKATFCILGHRAEGNEEILKRIADEGHLLVNHSYSHHDLTTLSASDYSEEMEKYDRLIGDATALSPALMRPTHGGYDELLKERTDRPLLLWSVDTKEVFEGSGQDHGRY